MKTLIIAGVIVVVLSVIVYFGTTPPEPEIPKTTFVTEKELQDQQIRAYQTDDPTVNFLLSECGLDEHCLADEIRNISTYQDEEKLLAVIERTMTSYEDLDIWCHHQGHHVGEFLFGYYGGDILEALSHAHKRCDNSLYHGMIENFIKVEVFLNDLEIEDIEVSTSCDIFEDRLVRLECGHGMGHGLVKASDFDLEWSAKKCDEFELTEQRQVCYRGVFMENIVAIDTEGRGVFDEDDPYAICNTLDEKYAQVCYQYHAKHIGKFTEGSVWDACDAIEPQSLIKYCYMGVQPFLFSAFHSNYQNVVQQCSKGSPEFQTYCYIGDLVGIVDWKGSQEGITFCQAIPEEFKNDCYDYLGKILHDESPDLIESICTQAESTQFQNTCRTADPEGLRILIT